MTLLLSHFGIRWKLSFFLRFYRSDYQLPYWIALVWFLTITSVFMSASYTMLVPFLPMYLIDELGVAQSDVNIWSGLIFSISFLISAIMATIWGALSDKKSH